MLLSPTGVTSYPCKSNDLGAISCNQQHYVAVGEIEWWLNICVSIKVMVWCVNKWPFVMMLLSIAAGFYVWIWFQRCNGVLTLVRSRLVITYPLCTIATVQVCSARCTTNRSNVVASLTIHHAMTLHLWVSGFLNSSQMINGITKCCNPVLLSWSALKQIRLVIYIGR